MADDDGLISGLTEEQLITNEEMDALVKEVSNPALARPARVDFSSVAARSSPARADPIAHRPDHPIRAGDRANRRHQQFHAHEGQPVDVQRRGTSPPLRSAPTPFSARRSARASRAFSPQRSRERASPPPPGRLLDPALTPSALRRSQEGCLKRLAGLSKPFKYVVTCNFVQKAGAGMHTASTALWDGKVDGKHTVQWENQTIQCITTVYWLAV